MATFSTKKILFDAAQLLPSMAENIKREFEYEGYEVAVDQLSSRGYDISITKGGMFKAVLGMKSALKVSLVPEGNNVNFEAGVGIWGQQAVPTVISALIFWPVILTQIWGMVEQSKLDDKALAVAEEVIKKHSTTAQAPAPELSHKFCTQCGTKNTESAKYCCGCGKEL